MAVALAISALLLRNSRLSVGRTGILGCSFEMLKRLSIAVILIASLALSVAAGVQSTGFSRLGSISPSLGGTSQNVSGGAPNTGSSRPDSPSPAIPAVWAPNAKFDQLSEIGKGIGIVYSPDFSMRGNRQFYEKLGFAYFEDPGWQKILTQIADHNSSAQDAKIQTLIIETHGTNGEGLKLQAGPARTAPRSYISIAGLKERLERAGVHLVILAACNAGRLFRPEIYEYLNPLVEDPLFLPPTLGIINASPDFDPATNDVIVARRVESHLETTNEGNANELSPTAQALMGLGVPAARRGKRASAAPSLTFAVSDMLIELLTHDQRLHLVASGYDTVKSRDDYSEDASEDMYDKFVGYINAVAVRQYQIAHGGLAPPATRTLAASRTGARRHIASNRGSGAVRATDR
jgi:hypothetical protein